MDGMGWEAAVFACFQLLLLSSVRCAVTPGDVGAAIGERSCSELNDFFFFVDNYFTLKRRSFFSLYILQEQGCLQQSTYLGDTSHMALLVKLWGFFCFYSLRSACCSSSSRIVFFSHTAPAPASNSSQPNSIFLSHHSSSSLPNAVTV